MTDPIKQALAALKGIEVQGPDADKLYWLAFKGATAHGAVSIGTAVRIVARAAVEFEQQRVAAIAALEGLEKAEPVAWRYTVNGNIALTDGPEPPPDDAYDEGSLIALTTCKNGLQVPTVKESLTYQPAEPVGWMFQHDETGRTVCIGNDGVNNPENFAQANPRLALICPLYRHPAPVQAEPAAQVVGLTDAQITALKRNGERYISSQDFARAAIAEFCRVNGIKPPTL